MDSAAGYGFLERVRDDLAMTGAVDPELFVEACVELEVWEEGDFSYRFEWMCGEFEDSETSAMHRFLDVAVCLWDGTLAEFLSSTDDGEIAIPNAVFYAAATAPLDPETFLIDRREWFAGTMRLLIESGRAEPLGPL